MTDKKKKNDNGKEVSGVICVIIASFFLICLITPLLSIIGEFVKRLTVGIVGYFAYPLFLCMLFYGIAVLLNKKINMTKKQILYICLLVIFTLLIIQLAVDGNKMNNYSDYIASIMNLDTSAPLVGSVGGAIFGSIAFGVNLVVGSIFSFVLYGMLFVLFAVIFIYDATVNSKEKPQPRKYVPPTPFVKGNAQPQPLREINDTSLFVGNIVPTNKVKTQTGSFGDMFKPVTQTMSDYEKMPVDDIADKEIAKKTLFADDEENFRLYERNVKSGMNVDDLSSRANYVVGDSVPRGGFSSASTVYSSPVVKRVVSEPPKNVLPDLPPVALPPMKDFTRDYVDGDILNGDELSQSIKTQTRNEYKPDAPLNPIITSPSIVDVEEKVKDDEDDFDAPILNGDLFNKKPEKKSSDDSPMAIDVSKDLFGYVDNDSQIVAGDYFDPKAAEIERANAEREAKEREQNASNENYFDDADVLNDEFEEDEITEENYDFESDDESDVDADDESDVDDVSKDNQIDIDIESDYETDSNFDHESDNSLIQSAEDKVQDDSALPSEDENLPFNSGSHEEERLDGDELKAKIPDSLRLIDEVEDQSVYAEQDKEDRTGYYTKESPSEHTKNGMDEKMAKFAAALGLNKNKNEKDKLDAQIKIDDYLTQVPAPEQPVVKKKQHLRYNPPPIDLLSQPKQKVEDVGDCEKTAAILETTLDSLKKVPAKVVNITRGPAVTRYEIKMPANTSVNKIRGCEQDIAYALESSGKIRIEIPIPGKMAVGIEIPNEKVSPVLLREIIESDEFKKASSPLTLALGKDIAGQIMLCNLESMPHLLIAGTTGSGKSACLNSIIASIMYKSSPDDVRLILIDPKQVEFVLFKDMPHLLISSIINDSEQAINAFKWARSEMDRRYTVFAQNRVRNIEEYNNCAKVKSGELPSYPRVVVIVDELAELMLNKNRSDLEHSIMSMAQKARAAGMHLILATQRPSVDVITGTIKANLSSRIAFAVKSFQDSRTILDESGAEYLLGKGDMLYMPLGANDPKRIQGAFVTSEEIESVVGYVKEHNEVDYDEAVENIIIKREEEEIVNEDEEKGEIVYDPLMKEALRRVIESGTASASIMQRRFSIGYARASRIIDQMEDSGFIGPLNGSKAREVFITREMFKSLFDEDI